MKLPLCYYYYYQDGSSFDACKVVMLKLWEGVEIDRKVISSFTARIWALSLSLDFF
jgi:hypothetical protein